MCVLRERPCSTGMVRWGGRGGCRWKSWDQHHTNWGGPSPAPISTHVPDYAKIGQWNTTQRNRRTCTHEYTCTHAHAHTHRLTNMHRYQLEESEPCQCRVVCLRPAFNAATHIFPQNRHVLWTGTTGLRSGQKGGERERDSPPLPPLPTLPDPLLHLPL